MTKIGLNVLCQGATHPKSGRPTHPALATGGPAKLLEWILDKLKFFPAGAPVIIRIPGGWMPEDGPVHLLHQLAIGKPVVDFLDELDEWYKLSATLKVLGHPVYVYFGPPRTCHNTTLRSLLRRYFTQATGVVFDNTARAGVDVEGRQDDAREMKRWKNCGAMIGTEGWPWRESDHWSDPETLVFLQSNNARNLFSRHGTKNWDAELAPLDDWNFTGQSVHERIHIMVEEDNENGTQARDTAMNALGRGSTVYINPDADGKKWHWTPAQMLEVAARVYTP